MSEITVVSTAATPTAKVDDKSVVEVNATEDKNAAQALEASKTAEESAALENDEASDETEGEGLAASDDKPKQSKLDKRFKKLSKQKAALRDEVEYWKAEALKQQQSKQENPKDEALAVKTQDAVGEPVAEDYASHADYLKAVIRWTNAEEKKKEIKEQLAQDFEKTQKQKIKTHQERLASFAKTHADFNDVISEIEDVPMSLAVQDTILATEDGPHLMYELAKDVDEYARICALPYNEAVLTMGKILAKIEKEKPAEAIDEKTKTKLTTAPKPLSPVSAKASGVKKSLHEASTQAEYEAIRREQLKTKRSAWG